MVVLKDEKLIQEFVVEAKEHVERIELGLLAMEKGQYDGDLVNSIFRSAHNIKGTAGFFGFQKIVELSHAMENVLGKIRNEDATFTLHIIDVLLAANDELGKLLENIAASENHDITTFVQALQHVFINNKEAGNSEETAALSKQSGHFIPDSSQSNMTIYYVNDTCSGLNVSKLCKKGHRIYKYTYGVNPDKAAIERFCTNMSKSIQSIGTMLTYYIRNSNSHTSDSFTLGQEVIFLFSTVLEKELTVMALGANEGDIMEFHLPDQEAEVLQIITEAEQNFVLPRENSLLGLEQKNPELLEEKVKNYDYDEERIKVDVTLLNNLVNLASEMVLARNQLLRLLEKNMDNMPGLRPILQKIDHTTTEMQEKIMRTRMQPVSILFHFIPRLVRDLSRKLGKSLTLHMEGKEVEMDKSILEGLIDPFTHLVRNALDHGIEDPTIRKNLGKDPTASLKIKARHEGGRVIIDIIDDGAGINSDKIKQQAIKQGLINQEQAMHMSDSKALDLIFSPGLSTAREVSDISGRGVGLDVVRSNIEKFGGTVEVGTALGKGTNFRLLLPLTLAIIPSLILEVGKNHFALPQAHLQEIVRVVAASDGEKIQCVQGQEVLALRGKLVPIIHLSNIIELEAPPRESKPIIRILIMKIGRKIFGLIVDKIHGQEELLVKPMPNHLREKKIYSGVTILGDGSIAMVLDTDGIADAAKLVFVEEELSNSPIEMVLEERQQELQDLLLFQCSGPETLGLHLSMIARVNEIDSRKIEKIGNKEYYNFQGNIVQLVRPEDHLPVASVDNMEIKMYVIIPKGKQSIGILVRKIKDSVKVDVVITEGGIQGKGFLGSAIIGDKIVLLMDLYELFEMILPEDSVFLASNQSASLPKKVLLVEDTPFFIRLETRYLERAGYQVFTATNGRDALQLLQQQPIDVVVSDIHMPVMDGIEMIKYIRRDEQLAALPVIVVTDSIRNETQKKNMLELGFDSYAFKFDRTELLEKMVAVQVTNGGRLL
jgi:two-component system chemotaxis sensor kinase CheA